MPALRGRHHFKRSCSQGGLAAASVCVPLTSSVKMLEFKIYKRFCLFLSSILCFKSNWVMVWFYGGMIQTLKITEKCCPHHVLKRTPGPHCRPLFRGLGIMTTYGQNVMVSLAYVKNKLESFTAREMFISKTLEDWLHWKYQPAVPPSLRFVFLSWLWRFFNQFVA